MSKIFTILFLFIGLNWCVGQNVNVATFSEVERFPVFTACQNLQPNEIEKCFYDQVQDFVYSNFKVPQNDSFKGNVKVLFEVTVEGKFKVLYVDAVVDSYAAEAKKVIESMPKVSPATYNGKPTYSKYTIAIAIPLKSKEQFEAEALAKAEILNVKSPKLTELDSIVYKKYRNPEYESHLNVPFSHSLYAQFDAKMNQVGSNNHTASKPCGQSTW